MLRKLHDKTHIPLEDLVAEGRCGVSYPWFRMYHEFAGDPVIQHWRLKDQRHFVMALCLKAGGFLDREMPSAEFRHRAICKGTRARSSCGTDALRRLREVGLWMTCGIRSLGSVGSSNPTTPRPCPENFAPRI